jgi:hypothetical protein
MSLPMITMQPASGMTVPTIVYLPDSSTVTPNASGQISVAPQFVTTMIAAGWEIVVASGTTHVP